MVPLLSIRSAGQMLKACTILVLTVVCAAASLLFAPPPTSWLVAVCLVSATVVLFSWAIFNVNSSFWTKTLSQPPGSARAVALTFDDGPDPHFTPLVLDILAEKQVPATFFVVGERAKRHPELLRQQHQMGHVVGNHSHTHSLLFHFRHGNRLRHEINACNEAIRAAIGLEPRLFRAPHGFKAPALADVLFEEGMTAVGWQARGKDYLTLDPGRIAQRIIRGASNGGVLLLHDGGGFQGGTDRSPTLQALPLVIDGLRELGYAFLRLDRLFGVEAYRTERGSTT
jgi:peptidoglycan-N-acetylglucosamine deacetylase